MSGHDGRDPGHGEFGPDSDAMTLVSRALDVARRRLRYRIAAALAIAAVLAVVLMLVR